MVPWFQKGFRGTAILASCIMLLRNAISLTISWSRSIGCRRCLFHSPLAFSKLDDLMDDVLYGGALSDLNGESPAGQISPSLGSITEKAETRGSGWKNVDWDKEASYIQPTPPSPVDVVFVRGRLVYLKRDDQLRLAGSQISGNKARKMLTLQYMKDFPKCVVSYGGPQSNAMLAVAAVVHFRNEQRRNHDVYGQDNTERLRFVYYTKKLPKFLRKQPNGNLFRALALGMELIELSPEAYNNLFGSDWGGHAEPPASLPPPVHGDSIWIPQGGACKAAEAGTSLLAREIMTFWELQGDDRPLSVVLPGGTCSSANLLHHALEKLNLELESTGRGRQDIQVAVIPCVGDEGYARRQMLGLNAQLGIAPENYPAVLPSTPSESDSCDSGLFTFGEPNVDILRTFREMKGEHNVVLDLLYGASAWTILLRHWRTSNEESLISARRQIMYVHSGGLEGINSQLVRYRYKNLVGVDEIQMP